MTIRESGQSILKLLYEYYREQDARKYLSAMDIFSRLNDQVSDQEIDASLQYLVDKGLIGVSADPKTNIETYKITPDGIDDYENKGSLDSSVGNSPAIYVQGDLKGTVNLNFKPYAQDEASNCNHFYNNHNKEFMNNYDAMLHFIEFMRTLPKKTSLPDDLEIELTERCDDIETMVRSSPHLVGDGKQREQVLQFVDYAREVSEEISNPQMKKDVINRCMIVETLIGQV